MICSINVKNLGNLVHTLYFIKKYSFHSKFPFIIVIDAIINWVSILGFVSLYRIKKCFQFVLWV
jgi:hypothetical protein